MTEDANAKGAALARSFGREVTALEVELISAMQAAGMNPRQAIGLLAGAYIQRLAIAVEIAMMFGGTLASATDVICINLREEVARRAEAEAQPATTPPSRSEQH